MISPLILRLRHPGASHATSLQESLLAVDSFFWQLDNTKIPYNSALLAVYSTMIVVAFGGVIYAFRSKGARSIVSVSVYLVALSSMKLTVKLVYVNCDFNFPRIVTAYHFVFCMAVSWIILLRRRKGDGKSIHVPSPSEFWKAIFPISMAFVVSIAAKNMALVFASVSFTEIIGAASPIISIPIVVALGMKFNAWLLIPMLWVTGSCLLSMSGEMSFSAFGALLCLLANIFRSVKIALNQMVLTGDMSSRFDPVALLFWMCVPASLVLLFWSFAAEGLDPVRKFLATTAWNRSALLAALLASSINACCLNLSSLFVTEDLGAIGMQLIAQTKSILTLLSGMVIFRDTVTITEMIGFLGVLCGVWLHARWDSKLKASRNERSSQRHCSATEQGSM